MANKYIQQYNTQADYDSGTHLYPNVSLITSTDEVLYTTLEEGWDKIMSGATIGVMYIDGTFWTGNVTTVGYDTVPNKTSVVEVRMKDTVTDIGRSAFESCSNLTNITIPNNVTSLGESSFKGCSSLTNITIPNNVTSLGNSVFRSCTNLTSIMIPDSVTSIGDAAFHSCSSLTNITIPNNVTSLGGNFFKSCTSLTSVTIGDSVTTIGNYAFDSCTSLTNITSLATTAPTITNYTFISIRRNGVLTVPIGSTGYDVWMDTGNYYLGKSGWTKVEQ